MCDLPPGGVREEPEDLPQLAYQQYMQAKARGTPVVEEPQDPVPMAPGRGGKNAERRIDIQPAEDEDNGLSVKPVAHARFMRNHRLINIFGETMDCCYYRQDAGQEGGGGCGGRNRHDVRFLLF